MAGHNNLGKEGEAIAANFLINKNYKLLARSWTTGKLELDIIATCNNLLIIVEVKTRSRGEHADPDDTISNKKLKQIYDAAEKYIELHNISMEVRYDLITVIYHGSSWTIEHLEDAFYPFMNL